MGKERGKVLTALSGTESGAFLRGVERGALHGGAMFHPCAPACASGRAEDDCRTRRSCLCKTSSAHSGRGS
eukprot:9890996-Prorocentrum_lima.AAC.1